MKTVVFVETNFSGLYAIAYCRSRNYKTILITDSLERFRKWFPESSLSMLDQADQIITVADSSDVPALLEVIKNQIPDVNALLTFAEIRTKTVARLCSALGLKGANVTAIEIAQNKYAFRKMLHERGVETVQCHSLNQQDIDNFNGDNIKFPCFIKPLQGHSSIGATVCENIHDIKMVMNQLNLMKEDGISSDIVIEDYLSGDLVSVEILTTDAGKHQIVGISDRDIVNQSVETGASFPLLHQYRHLIETKACAALDAIGYNFGPSHVELIVTRNGPYLVEINTRVGGSGHSVMLDLATARSIVGDCVELCLGQLAAKPHLYQPVQGAAWKCFVHPGGGQIKKLPSLESIKEKTGVTAVWFHHTVGEIVGQLNSNFNWIVQVMCTGSDQIDAKNNADNAVRFIAAHAIIE